MKKIYLLVLLTLLTFSSFSQVFNNAGGDGLWSNTANWSTGVLPDDSDSFAQINTDATLNLNNVSLKQIRKSAGTASLVVSLPDSPIGDEKITFTNTGSAFICFGNTFEYNAPAVINGSGVKQIQVSDGATITFGEASVLTLSNTARVIKTGSSPLGTGIVNFNGKLEGAAELQFNYTNVFGATADNSAYTGNLVFFNTANVTVNTTGIFLNTGSEIQAKGTASPTNASSLTITTENSCKAGVGVYTEHDFTLDLDAKQENFGAVNMEGTNGSLTIDVTPLTTSGAASFTDSSALTWNGTVTIVGFKPSVIRFGTTSSGLTATQLTQITGDGVAAGEPLALDTDGYLVLASTLSTNDIILKSQERISFPSLVDNVINFSKSQNNVKIYSLTGAKVLDVSKERDVESLNVSQLNTGIYLVVFDNKKVEKFIKK